ncbi:methyltransferase domain-containing protein [Argonema galeatum]|uniref:methyltransferase domain-containing protein n=1 Tax=Argonema galeatum TaxID=2942762 RepID=UPI002010D722|nr:methyltransferase domain-containing protein [Argonema galeatum]MCL1463445.1 methyltransferase domain-containing protein [Argonema galeatum A003/A1]
MNTQVKLTESTQKLLCCPVCRSKVVWENEQFQCTNSQCKSNFPVVEGIPILIDEKSSIFSFEDFLNYKDTTFDFQSQSKIKQFVSNLLPDINANVKGKKNYDKFLDLVMQQNARPKILVVGGGIVGEGMEDILSNPAVEIISSDVSFGPCTALICDAHDIPFADNSFDGVIVQAVLEHVVDPNRCVEEIHRVLKPNGVVYAETPFMQQVHMGRYDFTRFTHLGHRRLFRKFEEISGGPVCGPGMALAWSYQYFLLSFVKNKAAKNFVKAFTRLTSFWLKYFDYFLIDKAGTFDAAAGYYFLGKKSDRVLDDRELLKLYKGIQ